MSSFLTFCERKFPKNWIISDNEKGLFHFRDSQVPRGMGFIVVVQEETVRYDATLVFEDFSKELSAHAEKKLLSNNNPIRKLLESSNNLSSILYRKYAEYNLNPDTSRFENWSFNLEFRKTDPYSDADRFSDILISFILFLFPYNFEAEEEGAAKSKLITTYERSHLNRSLCLAYYGYNCMACNTNLKEKYGEVARDFIHVHHLNPISTTGLSTPDPINDFVPLCPNCHAIAHLKVPPYSIEEIKLMLKENGNTNSE
jgi:hypothetical protein